jgi:hypothetical protein
MVTWVGTGILSDPDEPWHDVDVENAPHAHEALQLAGYDASKHRKERLHGDVQTVPSGYSRLFCWRRVDGIVRDFSRVVQGSPVNVRSFHLGTIFPLPGQRQCMCLWCVVPTVG